MKLCFELSMPNNNAWNGKWTGDEKCYAIIVNTKQKERAREVLNKGYFRYNFGDGWVAGISVREVDAKEATRMKRKSVGFCGYNWMVDSIMECLEIKWKER